MMKNNHPIILFLILVKRLRSDTPLSYYEEISTVNSLVSLQYFFPTNIKSPA